MTLLWAITRYFFILRSEQASYPSCRQPALVPFVCAAGKGLGDEHEFDLRLRVGDGHFHFDVEVESFAAASDDGFL